MVLLLLKSVLARVLHVEEWSNDADVGVQGCLGVDYTGFYICSTGTAAPERPAPTGCNQFKQLLQPAARMRCC
jgi:hypothetical protein